MITLIYFCRRRKRLNPLTHPRSNSPITFDHENDVNLNTSREHDTHKRKTEEGKKKKKVRVGGIFDSSLVGREGEKGSGNREVLVLVKDGEVSSPVIRQLEERVGMLSQTPRSVIRDNKPKVGKRGDEVQGGKY